MIRRILEWFGLAPGPTWTRHQKPLTAMEHEERLQRLIAEGRRP